jgi:hypothetical protein
VTSRQQDLQLTYVRFHPQMQSIPPRLLIQTYQWLFRIIWLLIGLQNALQFGDVVFIEFRHSPFFPRHGLRSCWSSRTRTVSRPTRRTSRRLTASSATSRTAHRAQPSGGSLQTMAINALPLAVLQQRGRAGTLLLMTLLLIECAFDAALPIAMADLPNCLRGQGDKSEIGGAQGLWRVARALSPEG